MVVLWSLSWTGECPGWPWWSSTQSMNHSYNLLFDFFFQTCTRSLSVSSWRWGRFWKRALPDSNSSCWAAESLRVLKLLLIGIETSSTVLLPLIIKEGKVFWEKNHLEWVIMLIKESQLRMKITQSISIASYGGRGSLRVWIIHTIENETQLKYCISTASYWQGADKDDLEH